MGTEIRCCRRRAAGRAGHWDRHIVDHPLPGDRVRPDEYVPEYLGGHAHLDEVEDVPAYVPDPRPVLGHLEAEHARPDVVPADVDVIGPVRDDRAGPLDG